jgi:hypothetical protein
MRLFLSIVCTVVAMQRLGDRRIYNDRLRAMARYTRSRGKEYACNNKFIFGNGVFSMCLMPRCNEQDSMKLRGQLSPVREAEKRWRYS